MADDNSIPWHPTIPFTNSSRSAEMGLCNFADRSYTHGMRLPRFTLLAAVACALAPVCHAQYTVKRLVFTDRGQYSQQQLESAVNLQPGTKIGTKEMGEAAQRLMDTGAFTDIETTVDGPFAGVSVVFKTKPETPANFLPVTFQNFVWFTDAEREAGLKQRIPLYTGRIPAAGSTQEAAQKALVEMLAAKGVTAKVETEQWSASATVPTPLMRFWISSPAITLDAMKLAGVPPQYATEERNTLQAMLGRSYSGSDADLNERLLAPLQNAGFIDARIDGFSHVPPADAASPVKVTISGTVVPGEQYHFTSLKWAGSPLFSAADFDKGVKLHAGDLASASLLRQSYQPLVNAYLSHGYVDAMITAVPTRDDTVHTVSYAMTVVPGEVYHVGTLSAVGLSPQDRAHFDTEWKMISGQVYDATYFPLFISAGTAPAWLRPYGKGYAAQADPATHTVNMTITFAAAAK
jgi:outer membrane protein assembly factor BamA